MSIKKPSNTRFYRPASHDIKHVHSCIRGKVLPLFKHYQRLPSNTRKTMPYCWTHLPQTRSCDAYQHCDVRLPAMVVVVVVVFIIVRFERITSTRLRRDNTIIRCSQTGLPTRGDGSGFPGCAFLEQLQGRISRSL